MSLKGTKSQKLERHIIVVIVLPEDNLRGRLPNLTLQEEDLQRKLYHQEEVRLLNLARNE